MSDRTHPLPLSGQAIILSLSLGFPFYGSRRSKLVSMPI